MYLAQELATCELLGFFLGGRGWLRRMNRAEKRRQAKVSVRSNVARIPFENYRWKRESAAIFARPSTRAGRMPRYSVPMAAMVSAAVIAGATRVGW